MALNILQLYTTREGQTAQIMTTMAEALIASGHAVTSVRLLPDMTMEQNWQQFDWIVIGGSVHYGKHEAFLADFITSHKEVLARQSTLFFSVNLTARKPEKRTVETNPYVKKFLTQVDWQPTLTHVFAGALRYSEYRFWDKQIIRFIMWITKGNTDTSLDIDYTNWNEVKELAQKICE